VLEMKAPIQSPAKYEVRSVIRFLSAKVERPAEIHKQIVAVYGNVMNRQNVTKWGRELAEGRTDVHDEQRSVRPSLIADELLQGIEEEIRANRRVTIRKLHHINPEVSKTTNRFINSDISVGYETRTIPRLLIINNYALL